jgi:hypothetical protein
LNYDKDIPVNSYKNFTEEGKKNMKKDSKTNATKLRGKNWQKFLALAGLVTVTAQVSPTVTPLSIPIISSSKHTENSILCTATVDEPGYKLRKNETLTREEDDNANIPEDDCVYYCLNTLAALYPTK